MKVRERGIGTRLAIPLIAVAVVAIGALQYGWFSRAAAVEIDGAERSLRATVYQALSREFQMYAPLVGDIRELLSRGPASAADLEDFLEREYILYGPAGATPGLISSASIYAGPSGPARSLTGENGAWSAAAAPLPAEVQKRLTVDDGSGMLFLNIDARFSEGSAPAGGSVGLLYISWGGPRPLPASIGLDSEGLFASYLKPAIAGVLPGASLEWASARGPG